MVTVSLIVLPEPEAVKPVAPFAEFAVQVTPVNEAGMLSATVAPVTAAGPALVTTMVYVTTAPATTLVTPFVLVICKSARGVIGSLSVAVLFAGVGSLTVTGAVTVAVLLRVPLALAARVPVTV